MSNEELLFRKLQRLKGISNELQELNSELATKVEDAFVLLSDPTTCLDIVPRESLVEEQSLIKSQLAKTSITNRDFLETMINANIKDDRDLIIKKIKNFKINTTEDLIRVAACIKIIRKVVAGMSAELLNKGE